jgi:hypothetical protein
VTVPEGLLPLNDGQKASAEDGGQVARLQVNWLVDSNDTVRPRPGLSNATFNPGHYVATTGTSTNVIGMYVWRSAYDRREYLIYVRADRTIWAVDLVTYVTTALSSTSDQTTMLNGSGPAVFTSDNIQVIIVGGGLIQCWTGTGLSARLGPFVLGTSQPPQAATHIVNVGDYLIANSVDVPSNTNRIFWSDVGSANHATWNPLNFYGADASPEPIVAVGANLREVLVFKERTVQIFGLGAIDTTSLVPSATAFQPSMALSLGCSAPYSVIRVDEQFAMLDDTRRFVLTDGRQYQVISNDVVDLVRKFSTVSDCFGFRYRQGFWDMLVWIFPTARRAYAYDTVRSTWFQWRGWNGIDDFDAIRIGAFAYWSNGNANLVGDSKFENIWTLDEGTFSDQAPGLPILCDRVTEQLDWGTAGRKRCNRVRFFVKRGQAVTPGTAFLDVAKSDDGGAWSGKATLDLGAGGDYTSFVDWYPGGIYRRRRYRVRYSSGVDVSITRATEDWEALTD